MDNIRNLTFRIKSCIACNENQCPAIKERLEQHALSYHSTFRPSAISPNSSLRNSACTEEECPVIKERLDQHLLSHHSKYRPSVSSQHTGTSSDTYTSPALEVPNVAIINSDEQTSTENLAEEDLKPLRNPKKKKECYKEAVEREILIWAEDLPKYPNPSAENLKQNLVNELIEKVDSLKSEVNEEFYDVKLSNEVCKFLDSLPLNPYVKKRVSTWESMKLQLIHKICDLNKKTINRTSNINSFVKEHEYRKKATHRNSATNTRKINNNNLRDNKISHHNYFRKKQTKTIGTTTSQFAFDDKYISFRRPEFQNMSSEDIKHADAQVQHNFYNMPPYYGQIYGQQDLKIKKQQKNKINEDVCKQKISIWLAKVTQKSERNIEQNDKKVLTDILYNRLRLLLSKKMNSSKYKLVLKGEILNFLYDYFMVAVATNGTHFNKLVDNLAITLLVEKANSETPYSGSNTRHSYYCTERRIGYHVDTECYYKPVFNKIVTDALENVITHSENIENDLTDILLDNIEQIRLGFHEELKEDLHVLLKSSTDLYDISISDIVNVIMDQLVSILCDSFDDYEPMQKVERPPWFNILTAYKSELELSGPPKFSKTYLQRYSKIKKKSEPKLNPDERAYNQSISALIADWVKTLPKKRNKTEDMIIKETIINSIAFDIIDQVKLEAVAPEIWNEKEKYLTFFIYRWLNRFEYFDDINNAKPYVDELMKKLKDIPFPAHGSQPIKKINKFMKMTSCSQSHVTPEDIYEDEILMIINAQPSKIFIDEDKEIRSQQVHEFTLNIHDIMSDDSSNDISKEINKWLTKIIKPNEKEKLISLKEQLTERINSLLRERTSHFNNQNRTSHGKKDVQIEKVASACCESIIENTDEPEIIFKEFIATFIEHYNEVENLITREVFGGILKIELQKLIAPRTKDYDAENQFYVMSTPNSLYKELKYVKIISDWLKILPIPTSFNSIGNKPRKEIVNCLAKNLNEIDENRMIHPSETEYKVHLASIINKYADKLPIPTYHKKNISAMVDNLVEVIVKVRSRPCCLIPNCTNNIISSINSTNIPDEQLSSFMEKYICENCEELSEDELKLEAVSARMFTELDKMRNENSGLSNSDEAEEYLPRDEPVRRLSYELIYSKEITDCLNNLPLLPLTDNTSRNSIVKMICHLAEKMYERWLALYHDPNNTYVNTILSEYIMQWILELPLDTSKEIDESIIIQQLLNRMERANKRKLKRQEIPQTGNKKSSSELCQLPFKCCNNISSSYKAQDPGAAIVDAIENWCAELPVQTEIENTNSTIKDYIATNLFKKVSELNMNPICFTDNNLYRELLSEEIDEQLGNLPESFKLQTTKEELKQKLVSSIMENKKEIREQASSTEYKQELENTINLSLPNPVQAYQEESPGFKIYKDRLATIFILENFDHGYDDIKENYTKRIKKEIDKYFQDAQKRNAIPLTKDQIYNDLYSALFNVPLPNDASIAEEVEEIKTRCEIDKWFESLPLRAASSVDEDLVKNQILAMLAKRIHRMEKYERNADDKIHKEVTKWLLKLPLLPGRENSVDEFARILLQRLKSTFKNRKCIRRDESVHKDKFVEYKNKTKGKGILDTSQVAGPSREHKMWPCPASPTCCQISPPLSLKPADIIMNIVEMWCQQLPLTANTNQESDNRQVIKDNLIIKIIMKISELNVNPETFNNDFLYEALLDDELENLLSTLSTSNELNQSREMRKDQLKHAIMSVKPLIQKEKAKYEYKLELQNIVDIFLKEPLNLTPELRALCVSLKTCIIDNFILHNYYKTSKEGSLYKMMVNFSVEKYFTKVCENDGTIYNPLMVGNQLICELAKVSVPSKSTILEEIREIRIKFEITDFFDEHSLCDRNDILLLRNQIISALAKRLCELGNSCNTGENFSKMKSVIVKYLKKLDEIVDIEKIDSLVQRLLNLPDAETPLSETSYENFQPLSVNVQKHNQSLQTPTEQQRFSRYHYGKDNQNSEDGQWMSLLSVTTKTHDPNSNKPNITELEKHHLSDVQKSQFKGEDANNSMMKSKTNYLDFKRSVGLTSSVREEQESNDDKWYKLQPNERTEFNSSYRNKGTEISQPKDIGPISPEPVPKSFTSKQEFPKLFPKSSDQGSTNVQDLDMVQSNPFDDSSKVVNDQQSFPISNIQNCLKQTTNTKPQNETLIENQTPSEFPSSTPDNRITQFSPYKQNQSIENENLQQPKEETPKFFHRVTQQLPHVTQNVPKLAQSNSNNNQSYTIIKETTQQDTQFPTPSSDYEERDRLPNLLSTETSKSSAPFTNMKESSLPSLPSQSSSSTPLLTPRRIISESNPPCCKRRPSILFFNPSDLLSESNSSNHYTQTDIKKRSNDLTSAKDDESKACKCDRRKKLCRSEIPICRAHKKRRCKLCSSLGPFYCKMPPCRYPGFYYY